jgi:hypothetical protein
MIGTYRALYFELNAQWVSHSGPRYVTWNQEIVKGGVKGKWACLAAGRKRRGEEVEKKKNESGKEVRNSLAHLTLVPFRVTRYNH